jgi:hypothetical protein
MQEHQQNNKNDQVDKPVISDYNPLRHAIIANIAFLIIFIIIGLFTLVSGIVTIKQTGFSNNVLLLFSLTTVMFILCLIFCIVLSQAFKSRHSNYKFDYIKSSQLVTFSTPYPAAIISNEEKVLNFIGPIQRYGLKWSATGQFLNHLYTKSAENTLLFTDKQIIAILVGPSDINKISNETSSTQKNLSFLVNFGGNYFDKNSQINALFASKWPLIVNRIIEMPLTNIMQDHLNFGIPYSLINQIEIIDKGLIKINLKNGDVVNYFTFNNECLVGIKGFVESILNK